MSLERLAASARTSDHQPIPNAATRNGREFMRAASSDRSTFGRLCHRPA